MTTSAGDLAGHRWTSAEPTCVHAHLMPAVHRILTTSLSRKPMPGLKQPHGRLTLGIPSYKSVPRRYDAELAHQWKEGNTRCITIMWMATRRRLGRAAAAVAILFDDATRFDDGTIWVDN
jgi:hypothetical protein